MKKPFSYYAFRVIRFLVWIFYPKITVEGLENIPNEPAIYVGNHAQMNGPLAGEFYFPVKSATWCTHEMMEPKLTPTYAFEDFWSQKPRWQQPFFRVLAYLITPIAYCLFNHAKTIPVYRDMRVMETFRISVDKMKNGESIVIFPEYDKKYNHILYEFQEHFVDTARFYCRRNKGKSCQFVPFYLAPRLRKMVIGKPITFDPKAPIDEERQRIIAYLKDEITRVAESLPTHTVVPYRNIPKKLYPLNHTSAQGKN